MDKKIAVLGHRKAMEIMMSYIEPSIASKFVFIENAQDLRGIDFSDFILLDSWQHSYNLPYELLDLVKMRIR